MALAGNVGVDVVHATYIPFYQGFINRVTLVTAGTVFYQSALRGEAVPNTTVGLRGAGASIVLTEPMYFRAESGGQELNWSPTPEVSPLFIGQTLVTTNEGTELLQKLLIEGRVHNQLLAEAFNLSPAYLAPAESTGL
jgi:hypothetical protein